MDKWISHFHCSQCEQCIDIGGENLVNVFEPTIVDNTAIHVYKCPNCGRLTSVVVEYKDNEWKFGKFINMEEPNNK